MTADAASPLAQTPLAARHRTLGARMVDFGGWDMPLEYSGISDEHLAVRTRAAIFDVSHMGEIEIAGDDALAGLQRVSCNDASKLAVGQAQYSALTTPEGGFVDDIIVYRLADAHFLLVVNAANTAKAARWITEHARESGDVIVFNSSSRYGLLAVQGPRAIEALQPLTGVELAGVKRFWFANGEVASVRATIARTGYTGEDGFELLVPTRQAERVWTAVLEAGRGVSLVPAGLGARDTLRLEAGMRLYGNDIDEQTTVLEAGLEDIVSWDKGDFVGRDALERQKGSGVGRKLVGFEMVDPGIARHGHDVYVGDQQCGIVTSGTRTPFLEKAIGMTYLPGVHTTPGTEIAIDIRGRRRKARVVELPFYKRR